MDSHLATEDKVMNVRPLAATRRRTSAISTTVLAVASIAVGGQTIARAQGGRATNQRPGQGFGTPNSFNAYGLPRIGGRYSPYPVKDPTAEDRAEVAGRVYRGILDEWAQRVLTSPRPGRVALDVDARPKIELIERLGPWSLRWQDAQDNAARSRAARYQAMSDHLGRMSALEDGRFLRETGQTTGGLVGPKPPRGSAEVARFFRPIDGWDIDRIIPTVLLSERPLNPQGVAVTYAEQDEIAERVYHMMLDDAVDRFLAAPRGGATHPDETAIFDALLAERLGFWSDLRRQSQDVAVEDPSWRSSVVGDRSARVPSAGSRTAGAGGRTTPLRSHVERMGELENGRFIDDALKQAGRTALEPVDMTRFREFALVVRFFRIEAESRLPGASRSKATDVTDSGQTESAGQIYRAILDEAAHRYREAPRAGEAPADLPLVFDSRLAERLAAWSIHWARAQISTNLSRVSQFNAVRSHVERMASLKDGRSFVDTLERAGHRGVGGAAPAPPREFADVARFFHLEALWELEQVRSR
jgi:hypothetical protein